METGFTANMLFTINEDTKILGPKNASGGQGRGHSRLFFETVVDHLGTLDGGQGLVAPKINRLLDEPHRAVGHEEVGPAGVQAGEFADPIVGVVAVVAGHELLGHLAQARGAACKGRISW